MKTMQKLTMTTGPIHRDLGKMSGNRSANVRDRSTSSETRAQVKETPARMKNETLVATGTVKGGDTRKLMQGAVSRAGGPAMKSKDGK